MGGGGVDISKAVEEGEEVGGGVGKGEILEQPGQAREEGGRQRQGGQRVLRGTRDERGGGEIGEKRDKRGSEGSATS